MNDGRWENRPKRRTADAVVVLALVAVLVVAGISSQQRDQAETGELVTTASPGVEETLRPLVQPPQIGQWEPMSPAPFTPTAPSRGVWSGEELLVWDNSDTGAMFAYLPEIDAWEQLDEAPGRIIGGYAMVWTGDEVVVWGGRGEDGLPTSVGYRFSREQGWRLLPVGPLTARTQTGMIWDDIRSQVVIWGGDDVVSSGPDRFRSDGATFDPATNEWALLPDTGLAGRVDPSLVGLIDGIVIVGGSAGPTEFTDGVLLDGARIVVLPPPPAAFEGPAPYATTSMGGLLTWGRPADFSDPAGYNWVPFFGWQPLPRLLGQERARADLVIQEVHGQFPLLIVWGGLERRGVERVTDGFWLNVANSQWRTFPPAPLSARSDAVVVATDTQLLVWGGNSGGVTPTDGARLGLPLPR